MLDATLAYKRPCFKRKSFLNPYSLLTNSLLLFFHFVAKLTRTAYIPSPVLLFNHLNRVPTTPPQLFALRSSTTWSQSPMVHPEKHWAQLVICVFSCFVSQNTTIQLPLTPTSCSFSAPITSSFPRLLL